MKACAMTQRIRFVLLGLIATGFLISTNPATAASTTPAVKEIKNLKVEGHFFTTAISNSNQQDSVIDGSKSRYLILVVTATSEKEDGILFATDFTLRYFHGNEDEDRSRCTAMAISETTAPEKMFYIDEFAMGDLSWIKLHSGLNRFALAFVIQPDVESIDLYRLGMAEPLNYRVGKERLYSVFIITNIDSKTLSKAKEIVQKGGYQVTNASENLDKEQTGMTIHYREQSESQANEISKLLKKMYGKNPTLKEMKLISSEDIVIWLGK